MKCSKLASGGDSVAKIRSLIAGHDDLPVDEAVRVALAQRDGRLLIFERRLEALAPATPADSNADSGTGYRVPELRADLLGELDTERAEGDFLRAYGNKWDPYPNGWKDTSKKGNYNPGIISVRNGVMNMKLNTVNGVPQVAAPQPKINGNSDLLKASARASRMAGLLTNLLTNRSVSRGTAAHVGDRSPRSRPGIRSSRLSMAWKRSGVRVP
jgi:hypothetical protein